MDIRNLKLFRHLSKTLHFARTSQACPECMAHGHDSDAVFCKFCSARLNPDMS